MMFLKHCFLIIKSFGKNKLTTDAARFIDSLFDNVIVRLGVVFPSDEGGVIGDKSLFEAFEGRDNEPDRLVNTLKILERVRFFTGVGDIRPESGRTLSFVELITLSVREVE